MSSITNINNNASVVNVGRTTPVQPGRATADRSIPVVLATDQAAVPVEEQNKIQSEVALSLLGIPRSEVALGIFADVNTYDVNPSEWSSSPSNWVSGYGIRHLPNEAGALIEAPYNENAVLTSKRFFRYQPGRVSAATFGVKSTVSPIGAEDDKTYTYDFAKNPVIRKYGIFDNFDGYYWETRQTGEGDNFSVVRRTQSLLNQPVTPFGEQGSLVRGLNASSTLQVTQNDDYRIVGKAPNAEVAHSPNLYGRARQMLLDNKFTVIENTYNAILSSYATFYSDLATARGISTTVAEEKCRRDVELWIDFILQDLEWGGEAHVYTNLTNFQNADLTDTSFENAIYTELDNQIGSLSLPDDGRVSSLIGILTTAFPAGTPGVPNTGGTFVGPFAYEVQNALDAGGKPKLETIFDTKKYYWAYLVSSFNIVTGAALSYDLNGFTEEELKNKCQRDIVFILDGYKNDILGGGNAETKYNMSMYMKSDGMSVYTQIGDASGTGEIARHTQLQAIVAADLTGDENVILSVDPSFTYETGTGFGYTTSSPEYSRFVSLSDDVIANFTDEDTGEMVVGDRGFAGNLCVYRDGLVMTHAAVYDTNLLREAENIPSKMRAQGNEFTIAKESVRRGQHVRYVGPNLGDLVDGTIYRVSSVAGQKANRFTLEHVYEGNGDTAGDPVTFFAGDLSALASTNTEDVSGDTVGYGDCYIQTVVPFIQPDVYNPVNYRGAADGTYTDNSGTSGAAGVTLTTGTDDLASDGSDDDFPRGMMFPYKYSDDGNLESNSARFVGYINTTESDIAPVRRNIDGVNFNPEWINWVKTNVKPEYYGVYEYRVPRSRYSFDRLDGKNQAVTGRQVVFSDRAVDEDGVIAYPGQVYQENDSVVYADSAYDYDFTKVTMLKIEFSWYGAVGALFLAYVPVGNGEARWVRVHHLRASNQLKIASLGNATLPITYNVFGGGDPKSLGNDISVQQGYESTSHNIVKYGASYYIDGGDRGTVRLYSHNNNVPVSAIGKQWTANTAAALWDATPSGDLNNRLTLDITAGANTSVDPVFFMNARIDTGNRVDSNIRVIWTDDTHIYLSATPSGWTDTTPSVGSITLIPDRGASVYGLETKENIVSQISRNSVRNRVQVYPTKLSTSNLGNNPLRLRMKKTPIFQTSVGTTGDIGLSSTYEVTSENLPLPNNGNADYIQNGEEVYGWFQARLNTADSGPIISVFGRLYRMTSQYYFEPLETFAGTIFLLSSTIGDNFLVDKRFDASGSTLSGVSKSTSEKEGLSSILISDESQVPIPSTGINIATLYLQEGTEQFDLLSYFDYNKEYLSYPLTDQADTLYFVVDSDTSSATSDQVSLGVTWEEQ